MTTPTVTLHLSTTSVPQDAATLTASATIDNNGGAPTLSGTLQLYLDITETDDGTTVGPPFPVGTSYTLTLPNTTGIGSHTLVLAYSGDSNFTAANSVPVSFAITSPSTPPTPLSGTQAQVRPICTISAVTQPSRIDRENGTYAAEGYAVSGFYGLPSGSGYYDAHTVAVLYGTVAGVATRQQLAVGITEDGGIASLTGFNTATHWDTAPRLVITRWDGDTDSANYLGG